MLRADDVAQLVCPTCRGALVFGGGSTSGGALLERGALRCRGCGVEWPVEDGLARLYREEEVRGNDKLLRYIYDSLAPLHDPVVWAAMRLFQVGMSDDEMRDTYMRRVGLPSLRPRANGRPLRVLEVGVGCGANLPLIRRDLPPHVPVEVWGLDLSVGMLRVCRQRLRARGDDQTRLVLGDAHALPFPDGTFDRVFHVGAIANYRDPARGLAEMARVAVPGSPIVVVDEQLDRAHPQHLYHRAAFRLVTFYDPRPHCPLEHLPPTATDIQEEQMNRFFYCLTFRMPQKAPPTASQKGTGSGGPIS